MATKRARIVGVRLNEQETLVVETLVEETGLSMSDVVRQAIRTAHPDRFKKPKK